MNNKWNSFLKELSELYFFWFFGVVFFTIFRLAFITIFHKQIQNFAFSDFVKVLFMGFRFDCTVVAYFLLLPFLALLILTYFGHFKIIKKMRKTFQILFLFSSTIISLVTLNYFAEYNNQFNHFLFLGLYDDQKAVLNTILKDYHPILNFTMFLLVILIGILILNFFDKRENTYAILKKIKVKGSRFIIVFLTIVLFFIDIRGSVSAVPATRKWASVSKDEFLNKTVINPFRNFKYAYGDFQKVNILNGKNPYLSEEEFKKEYNLESVNQLLKKYSQGPIIEKPKQIFLVVMESYDSWPILDKYAPFGFSKNLKRMADNGMYFPVFLPAADATFDSFGAIVTDVPYCGVNISRLAEMRDPFITSIFTQFKKLGYQTNLYYGGFLSWQNIGNFCKHQGVDRIFSGPDAGGVSESGDWGVEDEKLFDLVLKNTDTEIPSLNIILTSRYHPPYAIDIYKKGFPYHSEEDFPKEVREYYDKGMSFEAMGHLWYGDKTIGDFVEIAEKKYDNSLYAFTGDHFGRRFINHKPNLYEKSSVSFILYGKNIPVEKNTSPGSHIDILPTLIEMIAPKGFEYYSFGNSLLDENKEKSITYKKIVDKDAIFYLPKDGKKYKINLSSMQEQELGAQDTLLADYNKFMSLAWHYTVKGDSLFSLSPQTAKNLKN